MGFGLRYQGCCAAAHEKEAGHRIGKVADFAVAVTVVAVVVVVAAAVVAAAVASVSICMI